MNGFSYDVVRYGAGRNDFRMQLLCNGRPYAVNTRTTDAARTVTLSGQGLLGRSSRDERLTALPYRSTLSVNGLVWTGEVRPHIDGVLEVTAPMIERYAAPGLSPHHELSAETVQEQPGMLGRPFSGNLILVRDLATHIRAAVRESVPGGPDDVDLGEVYESVEALQRSLETRPMNFGAMVDAFQNLKRSRDAVDAKTRRPTGDSRHPMAGRDTRIGGFSRSKSPAEINRENEKHWQPRLTGDNASAALMAQYHVASTPAAAATACRDAMSDFHRATDGRSKGDALNRAHANFWASRAPDRGRRWGGGGR